MRNQKLLKSAATHWKVIKHSELRYISSVWFISNYCRIILTNLSGWIFLSRYQSHFNTPKKAAHWKFCGSGKIEKSLTSSGERDFPPPPSLPRGGKLCCENLNRMPEHCITMISLGLQCIWVAVSRHGLPGAGRLFKRKFMHENPTEITAHRDRLFDCPSPCKDLLLQFENVMTPSIPIDKGH